MERVAGAAAGAVEQLDRQKGRRQGDDVGEHQHSPDKPAAAPRRAAGIPVAKDLDRAGVRVREQLEARPRSRYDNWCFDSDFSHLPLLLSLVAQGTQHGPLLRSLRRRLRPSKT